MIEHIPDTDGTLRLLHRCLKPGGRLIFSTDWLSTITDESVRRSHRAEGKVMHYFEPEGLRRQLEAVGFVNIRMRGIFRSRAAAKLFERMVREHFMGFGPWSKFASLAMIGAGDRLSPDDGKRGIFLCVWAEKGR